MCNAIAGELIISFHQNDAAAKLVMEQLFANTIEHVSVIESLEDRLYGLGLKPRDTKYKFYRLEVPEGQEVFKIGYLQFYYKHAVLNALTHGSMDLDLMSWTNLHMLVVPNSYLSLRQPSESGVGFATTSVHDDYKKLCLADKASASSGKSRRILVLDTGLDPASTVTVLDRKNLVDPSNQSDVTDDHGHGTAVAEIIRDLARESEFIIYKVADSEGRASEWDALTALIAKSDCHIVNMSLAFGLGDSDCPVCGRESHSSRSAVFENIVNELAEKADAPLIVAAAGNGALPELSYPARFSNVIAIESMNRGKELSEFSNRGALTETGSPHDNVFVLPGGEQSGSDDPTEYVGTASNGAQFFGTSFAAAYASGLIAALWSEATHKGKDAATMLDHLRSHTDKSLPNYVYDTHGNGLMQFV